MCLTWMSSALRLGLARYYDPDNRSSRSKLYHLVSCGVGALCKVLSQLRAGPGSLTGTRVEERQCHWQTEAWLASEGNGFSRNCCCKKQVKSCLSNRRSKQCIESSSNQSIKQQLVTSPLLPYSSAPGGETNT